MPAWCCCAAAPSKGRAAIPRFWHVGMAAAEKSVAAIILRRHVVTTDCMGRLMRTGCSREPPSRPYFSLLRESALKTRRYGPFLLDLVLYLRVLRARGWWQPVPHPVKVPFLACGMGLSPDAGAIDMMATR